MHNIYILNIYIHIYIRPDESCMNIEEYNKADFIYFTEERNCYPLALLVDFNLLADTEQVLSESVCDLRMQILYERNWKTGHR